MNHGMALMARKLASILVALGIVLYALYGAVPDVPEGGDVVGEDPPVESSQDVRDPDDERVVTACATLVERLDKMRVDEMAVGTKVRRTLGPDETIALCAELKALGDDEVKAVLSERFGL